MSESVENNADNSNNIKSNTIGKKRPVEEVSNDTESLEPPTKKLKTSHPITSDTQNDINAIQPQINSPELRYALFLPGMQAVADKFQMHLLPTPPHSQHSKPFYNNKSNRILFINNKSTYDMLINHNVWIYTYDPVNNTFYPEVGPQTIVNEQTNEIIMFAYNGWVPIFCIMDLKSKQVKLKIEGNTEIKKHNFNLPEPTCHQINIFNEIHLIESFTNIKNSQIFNHFKYDTNTQKFITCSTFTSERNMYSVSNIIFVESLNLLFAFGGELIELDAEYSDNIYCCQINSNKQNIYEWEILDIKLPIQNVRGKVINIFDTIIMFILGNNAWFFDLRYPDNGWYESTKLFPNRISFSMSVINISNDFIHFYDGCDNIHFKVSVSDMVPSSIYKRYGIMYGNMVNGFMKKIQKKHSSTIEIPVVLTKLIIMYFCNFKY
eukprot:434498_1